MTTTEVGAAYVTIIPSAKGFARTLQKSIAKEFAGSNLDKAIADALGDRPVRLPVQPDIDPRSVPEELPVPRGKEPRLPVELDPLMRQFQSQIKRELAGLTKEISAAIPVGADTAELRSELAAEISRIERELQAEISTEPAGQREYETRLRALVDDAQERVRAVIRVEPEVDRRRWRTTLTQAVSSVMGQMSRAASTVAGMASNATTSLTSMAAAVLAVGSAMSMAVSGTYLLGGALGSLPAVLAGATAGMATLSLGSRNVAEALEGDSEALAKLAPSARRFVQAVQALRPAFDRLQIGVQSKLFAGLDRSIRSLAATWLPQLTKTLGSYASTFNRLAKQAAASLSKKSFLDNVAYGAEVARRALERVGKAVAGPLVDAFGRLARAAAPVVERLGDEVAKLVEDFSAWIAQLDKSGELGQFFDRAEEILADLVVMGRDVASIFGSIMSILFSEQQVTNSPWEGLKATLHGIAEWFRDPENQESIRKFLEKLRLLFTEDLPREVGRIKDAIDTIDGWVSTLERLGQQVRAFAAGVGLAFDQVALSVRRMTAPIGAAIGDFDRLRAGISRSISRAGQVVGSLPGVLRGALRNAGTLLYQAGQNVIQGLIDGIRARIPSLSGAIGAAAQMIRNYLPFSPAKEGPLSGRGNPYYSGQSIAELLAAGVTSRVGAVEQAAGGLAGAFALAGSPVAGRTFSAAAAPTPAMVISFDGGAPDSFVAWLRDNIRINYGGSPQTALGS